MSTREEHARVELLEGTMDMLIPRRLLLGPAHWRAIVKAMGRILRPARNQSQS